MSAIVAWEPDTSQWSQIVAAAQGCRDSRDLCDNALWPIYGPLLPKPGHQYIVIGQLGQSLDGRIATPGGHSHYINGAAALLHLHRLRALADAVLVGVGTVIADDPQLTVRRMRLADGQAQPARIVVDPQGRAPATAKCFADDGARRIVIGPKAPAGAECIDLGLRDGGLAPADILRALRERGLRRILVEGGANTLSRFLQAGCLDRLHIMTGPLIIGSGPSGISLKSIETLEAALRPRVSTYALPDGDVLFDCAFGSRI